MMHRLENLTYRVAAALRRRLAVRHSLDISLEGFGFMVLTLAVGMAAVNTGANLLYLFFSMMAAMLGVSAIVSSVNLRKVGIRRELPDGVCVGDSAPIALHVVNRKTRMNSYSLRMVDSDARGEILGACYALRLPARGGARLTYHKRFDRRGRHGFGRLSVTSRFPFGFSRKGVSRPLPGELLVYPRLFSAADLLERQELDWGSREQPRKGLGASLYSLRDYTLADSAKMIHWKVSAKASTLIVREMEAEDELKATLILDNGVEDGEMAGLEDAFERAVSCVASVCRELIGQGFHVEIITRDGLLPSETGAGQLRRALRAMALVEMRPRSTAGRVLRYPEPGSIILWFEYGGGLSSPAGHASRLHVIDARSWPSAADWNQADEAGVG